MAIVNFEFSDSFKESPVTFWAHVQENDSAWDLTASHSPELPKAIPGKGYCRCLIEHENQLYEFASVHEIQHVIEVLEQKLLPTTISLSRKVSISQGPNTHWLSRLPLKSKSFKSRLGLTKVLRKAVVEHPENAI